MAEERIAMTKEGYEKKKAELDRKKNVEMIEVAKRIATAREMGPQRKRGIPRRPEDQGMLQARINEAREPAQPGHHRGPQHLADDIVVFGARVRVKDLDMSEIEIFHLVARVKRITTRTRSSPTARSARACSARRSVRSSTSRCRWADPV